MRAGSPADVLRRLLSLDESRRLPFLSITHFDFENCRYHWFLADAIASLNVLRRLDSGRAGKQ